MSTRTVHLLLLTGATLFAACATPKGGMAPEPVSTATVEAAHARWSDATMASLEQGRSIFLNSCNKCHAYPDLSSRSEDSWPRIVEAMGRKAKLSEDQTELVKRFVVATHATLTAK